MKTDIRRYYDTLSPRERLVLVTEALSEENEMEEDALIQSIPKKSYSGPDLCFYDSFRAMFSVSHLTVLSIQDYVIEYLRTLVTISHVILPEVRKLPKRKVGDPGHEEEWREFLKIAEKLEELEESKTNAIREARTIWEAFKTVCDDHGLDPEKVLSAVHVSLHPIFHGMTETEEGINEEMKERFLASFRKMWPVD